MQKHVITSKVEGLRRGRLRSILRPDPCARTTSNTDRDHELRQMGYARERKLARPLGGDPNTIADRRDGSKHPASGCSMADLGPTPVESAQVPTGSYLLYTNRKLPGRLRPKRA